MTAWVPKSKACGCGIVDTEGPQYLQGVCVSHHSTAVVSDVLILLFFDKFDTRCSVCIPNKMRYLLGLRYSQNHIRGVS
jgi:hypothetical protein